MGTVEPDVLVGRARELRSARAALAAADPRGAVVAISGEPGIGKSRLIAELRDHVDAAGGLVLDGRAAELERDRPFGVIVEALDAHVASLRRPELAALDPDVMAELARVLPSIGEVHAADRGAVVQDERYRAYRAVSALLERLALSRPLLLALDDLQWADPASVELVSHLLNRGPGQNVGLVLAFRAGQVPARLSGALGLAEREGATLIELEPLTHADAATWIGERVDPRTHRRLYERSGGNPFYLEQLVRAWERNPGGSVPAGVRGTIEAELDGLDEGARRVLDGGAVAGDPFEPDIAAAAADVDEAAALDAIDVLIERRLVLPTSVPRRFRFRHPIVREAVYETSGGGWRLAAHGRAAAALEAGGASPAKRAHHVERAASSGDMAAVELLAAAAEEARPRAPATAARWLGSALRLLPADASEQRLGLLVVRALALASAGELGEARAAALEALELVGEEPSPQRVQLIALAASTEHLLGRNSDAYARLRAELEAIPDQRGIEAATLKLQLAADRVYVAEFDAALVWAREARDLAEALEDRTLLAAATGALATAEVFAGAADRAGSHVDAATALLDDLTDEELASRIETGFYTGYAEAHYKGFDHSARHFERALRVSRATGQGHYIAPVTIGAAYGLERQGRLREALEVNETAIEVTRLTGSEVWRSWGLGLSALLLTRLGDVPAALRAGEEALSFAGAHESFVHRGAMGWSLGTALIEAGDADRGRSVLLDLCGGPDLVNLPPSVSDFCFDALAMTDIEAGRLDAARGWAQRSQTMAASFPLPGLEAAALRTRARVLVADGAPGEASELAARSARELDALDMRLEAARSRLVAGQALVVAGDGDAAAVELELAEAGFHACEAEPLRRRAAGALRGVGRRPPQRAAAAGDGDNGGTLCGLTERQREIARLVAEGRTNREIAAMLVLTTKSVDNHLARTFARLDITSRTALAALVISEEG